jgi:lycopene beta-cyclase
MAEMADVLIAGAGPAGRALAAACARAGLRTALADPAPEAPWRATYALWADEVPELPWSAVLAKPSRTVAAGTSEHELRRRYIVLRNDGLRAWLTDDRVEVLTGRVGEVIHGRYGATVVLADGRRIAVGVVVDATGVRRVLSGGPRRRGRRAEQTAFGIVVGVDEAERLVPDAGDTAVFMDWRPPSVGGGPDPTFLYSLPLGDGDVLVEETSLARRPGLSADLLAARLRARFAAAGVPAPAGRLERVRIPLDVPPHRTGQAMAFGVAAGFVHPATGYSLATSLHLAPVVAAALRKGLESGPAEAVSAARRAIWTPHARAVYALRRRGLGALLSMPPTVLPQFFDLFFTLPSEQQRALTSGREDLAGTAAMMAKIFQLAPGHLRKRLLW